MDDKLLHVNIFFEFTQIQGHNKDIVLNPLSLTAQDNNFWASLWNKMFMVPGFTRIINKLTKFGTWFEMFTTWPWSRYDGLWRSSMITQQENRSSCNKRGWVNFSKWHSYTNWSHTRFSFGTIVIFIYLNDIDNAITSLTKRFEDDITLHIIVKIEEDSKKLQIDLI